MTTTTDEDLKQAIRDLDPDLVLDESLTTEDLLAILAYLRGGVA